ncbi:MAG: DUF4197 domain-containing protein [Bacteroidetes bacterium]|nr:DUF4197 domain-containing protein [Bacteroidota bacterium]
MNLANLLLIAPGTLNFTLSNTHFIHEKIKIIACSLGLLISMSSFAQVNLNSILNSTNSALGNGLSNDKIVAGLKEALSVGTKKSTNKASVMDGFYKNPLIKIPFPEEAKQMESTLKSIGMKKEVDKFVKTMNRAAEDAAKKATPIFINAITKMSITDGIKILKGGDNAATQFLKNSTSSALRNEFKPVIKNSLKKVEITKYWNPLVKSYNQVPFVKKMNPDLDDYVTGKSIDGLFKLIANEELKIRKDPKSRVTDLLEEVFGKK